MNIRRTLKKVNLVRKVNWSNYQEITYEKVGKEKTLRSVGVQAKIKKKKFSSFTEYMKNF